VSRVEDRLRELGTVTRAEVKPSPQLYGRIRGAADRSLRQRGRLPKPWRHSNPSHPSRSSKPYRVPVLAIVTAVVIAIVVAVAIVSPFSAPKEPRRRQSAPHVPAVARPATPSSLIYQYADANPGARRVTLSSADGKINVPVVVLPDGKSVLGRGDLPVLPKSHFQAYQLWGIVGDQVVSLRLVGANPDFVSFTAPTNITMLFMTVEDESGAGRSTKMPVVSGLLNSPGFDGGAGDPVRNGALRNHVV
jgi:hypothetical protein